MEQMEYSLKKILWAVALAEGAPVSPKKFQEFVHKSFPDRFMALSELRLAVDELNIELAAREAPERLVEVPDGFVVRLTPEFAEAVRSYKGEPKPQKLTQAAMETLSIIAYRQPITRSQIETIRGVAADGPIGKLLELELIDATPNETLPGRPMVFTTTAKFLEQCGVKSLEELPQTEESENDRLREYFQKQETPAAQQPELATAAAAEAPAPAATDAEALAAAPSAEADATSAEPVSAISAEPASVLTSSDATSADDKKSSDGTPA
jgi:segregation and condensation protein B